MIRYTSMSRSQLTPEQQYEVAERARLLGANAGVMWNNRRHLWDAGASKGDVRVSALSATVYEALSRALDRLDAALDPWTNDEILTVAHQSGLV